MNRDSQKAEAFLQRDDATDVVASYWEEMDDEVRDDPIKMVMYTIYREGGMEPFYADLNACRRAPGVSNTDRHFNEKARKRMASMSEYNRGKIIEKAKAAGISTQGKYYVGGLGKYTDPQAWVSTSDDVVDVAKRKNMTVRGAVNHKGTPIHRERPPKGHLAPDIVDGHVKQILQHEPATREKVRKNPSKLNEVRERVRDKHAKRR